MPYPSRFGQLWSSLLAIVVAEFQNYDQPMHMQRDKLAAAYAEERAGLKEKLERLQKANKQRRQENAEMQDRFSAMHQRASAYDQVEHLCSLACMLPSHIHGYICSRWAQHLANVATAASRAA